MDKLGKHLRGGLKKRTFILKGKMFIFMPILINPLMTDSLKKIEVK